MTDEYKINTDSEEFIELYNFFKKRLTNKNTDENEVNLILNDFLEIINWYNGLSIDEKIYYEKVYELTPMKDLKDLNEFTSKDIHEREKIISNAKSKLSN